jgi:uncharacterized protein YjiS (DUF1127 family)
MATSSIVYVRPRPYRPEPRAANTAYWTHLLAGIAHVTAAVVAEYRVRRAARHLMRLDDLMLRDIGIGRGEIEHSVRVGRGS